ncbi:MAG: histidine phosphatase family protein, partial [Thiohalomonadales bacterium]
MSIHILSYNDPVDQTSTNQHASANITLIRHGEPVGGTRYRGRTNDPLSQLGWRQMHNANLTAAYWHQILSSPLNRCLDFARYIANSQHTRVEQSADFAEINFGEWEGKTAAELTLHDPMNFSIFLNNPLDYTPPKGENVLNFSQRIISAWENVINNL